MLFRILFLWCFSALLNFTGNNLFAQPKKSAADAPKQSSASEDLLFGNDDILQLTLTGNLNALFNDRDENVSYHPMLLQYKSKDSNNISLQLMVSTRGNFRRKKQNCSMPPLMLNFQKTAKLKNSLFDKQRKLKLVVPCRGDEYVIREWLVYKLYNLVTEKSFRAKLVQAAFEDSLMKRKTETHYCILLEDEKSVAVRNNCFVWNKMKINMENTQRDLFLKMAVFEYMIGNTDWSVPYLQNIKFISNDSTKAPFTIPYDFDHAGIVSAPYALPAEELEMTSVLERRYRGYCEASMANFAEVFAFYNKLKDDFYSVYSNCPLLTPKYIKFVTKYLNDFYKIINNDKSMNNEFRNPCRQTERIEIQGLKKRK